MLLRNWYKALRVAHERENGVEGVWVNINGKVCKSYVNGSYGDCEPRYAITLPYVNIAYEGSAGNYHRGLILGTGTTPPSYTDYKLEDQIKKFTNVSFLLATSYDENHHVIRTYTIVNDGNTDITINEYGYTALLYNGVHNSQETCLMTRDVLDTPLVIKAGETGKLIIKSYFSEPYPD